MTLSPEIQTGTLTLSGVEQTVCTLSQWFPLVDVYVFGNSAPNLDNSSWRLYAVSTTGGNTTRALFAEQKFTDSPVGDAHRILASIPGEGDTIELAVYTPDGGSAVAVTAFLVGYDPSDGPGTEFNTSAPIALTPADQVITTTVGSGNAFSSVMVDASGDERARGSIWTLWAHLAPGFDCQIASGRLQTLASPSVVIEDFVAGSPLGFFVKARSATAGTAPLKSSLVTNSTQAGGSSGGGGAELSIILDTNITAGQAFVFTSPGAVPHGAVADTAHLKATGGTIGGIALQSGVIGAKIKAMTEGAVPSSLVVFAPGLECAWGVDALGNPSRITVAPALPVPLAFGGWASAAGQLLLNPRRASEFDVRDFGAKCDGVTDDFVAVQFAVGTIASTLVTGGAFATAPNILYFPPGITRVTGSILPTTTVLCPVTLKGAGRNISILQVEMLSGAGFNFSLSGGALAGIEDLTLYNPTTQPYTSRTAPKSIWKPGAAFLLGDVTCAPGPTQRLLRCTRAGVTGTFPPFGRLFTGGTPYPPYPSNIWGVYTSPPVRLNGAPNQYFDNLAVVTENGPAPLGTMTFVWAADNSGFAPGPFLTFAGQTEYPLGDETTIAAGSDGAVLPQATIHVASTTGTFGLTADGAGKFLVNSSAGVQEISYTGKTGNTFTGCTGGAGTLHTNQYVNFPTTGLYIEFLDTKTTTTGAFALPQANIAVASVAGFTTSTQTGSIATNTSSSFTLVSDAGPQTIYYDHLDPVTNTFHGCTGGAGNVAMGAAVNQNFLSGPPQGYYAAPPFFAGFSTLIGDVIEDGTAEWTVIDGSYGILFNGSASEQCVKRVRIAGFLTPLVYLTSEVSGTEDVILDGLNGVWYADNGVFIGDTDPQGPSQNTNVHRLGGTCNFDCQGIAIACTGGATIQCDEVNFEIGTSDFAGTKWKSFAVYSVGSVRNEFKNMECESAWECFYFGSSMPFNGNLGGGGGGFKIENAVMANSPNALVPLGIMGASVDMRSAWISTVGDFKIARAQLAGGNNALVDVPVVPCIVGMPSCGGLILEDNDYGQTGRTQIIDQETPKLTVVNSANVDKSLGHGMSPGFGVAVLPQAHLDIGQEWATRAGLFATTINPGNNNNLVTNSGIDVDMPAVELGPNGAPASAFNLTGFVPVPNVDGQQFDIVNYWNVPMIIPHATSTRGKQSTAGNRILCPNGIDTIFDTPSGGVSKASFRYSKSQLAWILQAQFGKIPLPNDFPGLAFWLRADMNVTVAAGKVSTWQDVTQAVTFTQPTAGKRPGLSAGGGPLATLPAVTFDPASSQCMQLLSDPLAGHAGDWTIFYVLKAASTAGTQLVMYDGDLGSGFGASINVGGANKREFFAQGGSGVSSDGNATTNWEEWMQQATSLTNLNMNVNGASVLKNSVVNIVAPATPEIALGEGPGVGTGNFFHGSLYEVIAFKRALTAGEIAQIEQYVSQNTQVF